MGFSSLHRGGNRDNDLLPDLGFLVWALLLLALARIAVWPANGKLISLSSGVGDSGPNVTTDLKRKKEKPKMGLELQSAIGCDPWPSDNPGLC